MSSRPPPPEPVSGQGSSRRPTAAPLGPTSDAARIREPTVERPCPVCGKADWSTLFAEANFDLVRLNAFAFASRKLPENMHLRLHECARCETLYASPVFEPGMLAAAYRDAAYDSSSVAQMAAHTYGRYLPALVAQLPSVEGALDVGAGDGAFLGQLVEHGFQNVVGVEPSVAAVAEAPPAIRPLIRTGMFDPGDFAPGSFSLATCFQTIEHVEAPLKLCRDMWQLLRPGGAIFLIAHNRRSFSAQVLRRKSPIFDIEHLQLFSPRSLSTLLATAGFRDVKISTLVNRYPLSYWARLFPAPATLKTQFLRTLERARIGKLKLSVPAGNIAAVAFKP